MLKISSQNETKNLDFRLQNGLGFWRFWHRKSTSEGSWSPARSQNLENPKNIIFLIKKSQKNNLKNKKSSSLA